MKILYYDCFCGISGDMNLGAMIDLGVSPDYLRNELAKLEIGEEFELEVRRDRRKGIEGVKVDVILKAEHHHRHRHLKDIRDIINGSSIQDSVKQKSLECFKLIAEAEAKVHGVPMEKVHFHEVGAVDSIVDIVGAAVALDYLKVDRIMASSVQVGGGVVHCSHGVMPVPAPATAELLVGIPIKKGIVPHETTTPTGAAILASNVDEFTDRPKFIIGKIGHGLGTRDLEIPNVLRVFLAESVDAEERKEQIQLETNIDRHESKNVSTC